MIWKGALQKTGTLSRLERKGKDVHAVTIYTHMFVLGDPNGRADEREHLHYTAEGATPKAAMEAAHAIYEKAISCHHQMVKKSPTLLECRRCGIQQRTELNAGKADASDQNKKRKPKRRFFGLFRVG